MLLNGLPRKVMFGGSDEGMLLYSPFLYKEKDASDSTKVPEYRESQY